jgi:AraC-like DNA-binding protein
MHIRNLAQRFEITYVIKDKWHLPVHKHTHYELQFIIRGKGQHIINDQTYNYQKGDLFVLPPQDYHFFIFNEKTVICIVKFHEGFFEDFLQDSDFKQVLNRFSSPNRKILLTGSSRALVIQLMELIITENRKETAHQTFIIKSSLALVLALMSKDDQQEVQPKLDKTQAILNFIDQHITEKHLLSVEHISNEFNISKAYFNQYFSKETGTSYKKYVQQYALNLIAHQLLHSDKTLRQLADEFGYSDESHLSNAFKSQFGQSPSIFKKENLA